MNPVIVGSRVYTDLGAAIADSDGKSFTYSEARMAPATIPTGEAIAQLMIAALTEINPTRKPTPYCGTGSPKTPYTNATTCQASLAGQPPRHQRGRLVSRRNTLWQ